MRFGSLIVLLLSPVWSMLFHGLVCRIAWIRARPRQLVAASTALATAIFMAGLLTWWDGGGAPEFLFSICMGGLLGHIYFHIFNMSETARRIRLLLEIREGSQTPAAETYSPRQMISVRLIRLRELGQADFIDGRYFPRDSWLLRAAVALHWHEKLVFPQRFRPARVRK